MIRRPLRQLTAILVVLSAVAATIQLVEGSPTGLLRVFFAGVVTTYLVMGVLIMERRPSSRVEPIVYAMGLIVVFYLLADMVVVLPVRGLDVYAAWSVTLLDAVFFLLIALLFLSFPDGHLPSPAWWPVVALDIVLVPVVVLGTAIRPGVFAYYPSHENPFGLRDQPLTAIADVAYVGMIAIVGTAALTLVAAAAAFQSLRRRVQAAVDRRFDRARFDADRTSSAFAERVRDEVDIETVAADLGSTVAASLRPDGLGLWLRGVAG